MRKFILFLFFSICSTIGLWAQLDTLHITPKDSVVTPKIILTPYQTVLQQVINKHQYLSASKPAIASISTIKKYKNTDIIFYILAGLTLVLGCIKVFFGKYFNTLFRVFFNTSLRQSQLTDQLLQAKLPSLFYNIFFVCSSGVFAYLLLQHYNQIGEKNNWLLLVTSVVFLAAIYVVKYSTLKLTGWLTGFTEITNTYTFVLFLINKILGIVLLPLSIAIAFAQQNVVNAVVIISLLFIGFMLVLRFFRSYGLLQHQLKVSKFHFLLYILGVEILPLLLIYKGLILFLSKNT